MIELFESPFFHLGHYEIQFKNRGQQVGVCERCRSFGSPADVLAYDINEIHKQVTNAGARAMLWGDLLIDPALDGGNVNGEAGEVFRAVDRVPRDLLITDWHYTPAENYHSNEFFIEKGFDVTGAVWFSMPGISAYTQHARQSGAGGMIMTTWCRPDPTQLPLTSILYAAQCFTQPSVPCPDDPNLERQLRVEAERLWQRWREWST